jgi:hypothetical protein
MDDQYLKDDDDDRSNESIPTSASDVSSQNGSELSEVATTDKLKSQKLIFLRAAEDGNLNQLQQLIQENPDFITVRMNNKKYLLC